MLEVIVFMLTVFLFIHIIAKLSCGITKNTSCLVGKTAIVTGGNRGIGYEVCLILASRGCKVIIVDKDDAEESRKNIIHKSGNPNVIAKYLNLDSLKSVREFASYIVNNEERLDILIHNAGVVTYTTTSTEDGLNAAMQINYFSPFLLTHLLVDLLKKSTPSRIIFTSSAAAFSNNLSMENLNCVPGVTSDIRNFIRFYVNYSNSKMCLLMASMEFAEKLKDHGVTSNSLHPGMVFTNIFRSFADYEFVSVGYNLLNKLFGKDAWFGAQTTVHLAAEPDLENSTGKYFWDCKEFFIPAKAKNAEFRRKIWEATEKYVLLTEDEKLYPNKL